VALELDELPEIASTSGRLLALALRAPDVVEVCIEPKHPVVYLPGQYFQVRFRGFPARCFSPTEAMHGPSDDGLIRLHVRRLRNGRVSLALGEDILPGHRLRLDGPFGSTYFREGQSDRLVLVAGGTGFAPIWSIAVAAKLENPMRDMVVVVGARSLDSLYMVPSLCRLARYPNVTIVPVTNKPQDVTNVVRTGSPVEYLPPLSASDIVYVCGAPAMVDAVATVSAAVGARCYADRFVTAAQTEEGMLSRAATWLAGAGYSVTDIGLPLANAARGASSRQ